jgi:hypothetical protein
MYLQPQGQNPIKLIQMLEKRVEMLENMVKELQSTKPKMGRPPKGKNEPNQLEGSSPIGY